MQIKLFRVPAAELGEELNKFLRSHRVLTVEKQLVQSGQQALRRTKGRKAI
jgi:hypothetical protein